MPAPSVSIPGPLAAAVFLARPNRFLLEARLAGGAEVVAHLPDPGRLIELLAPGRRIWLRPAARPSGRKTAWTAVLVEGPAGSGLVSLDTTLPNRLVAAALVAGSLPELAGWSLERAEAPVGRSRFDFLLRGHGKRRLALEVKSVTLVEKEVGLFPDAVTARGTRHLRELAVLAGRDGWEAAVFFVAQRADVVRVRAAREIDPGFAAALEEARRAGVRVLARRCRVGLDRVSLGAPVPVLSPERRPARPARWHYR